MLRTIERWGKYLKRGVGYDKCGTSDRIFPMAYVYHFLFAFPSTLTPLQYTMDMNFISSRMHYHHIENVFIIIKYDNPFGDTYLDIIDQFIIDPTV